MFLRVRGKGGCPENSQAALMYMRAFCTVPTEPTPGGYIIFTPPLHSRHHLSPSSSVVVDSPKETGHHPPPGNPYPSHKSCPANTSSLLCSVRSFIYPTFLVGLNYASTTTTASPLRAAKKADKEACGDSAPSDVPKGSPANLSSTEASPPSAVISAEHFSSTWRELWNVLDILYDDVPLFPSLPIPIVNACLSICFPVSTDDRKDDPPKGDGAPSPPVVTDARSAASQTFAALQPFPSTTTTSSSGIAGRQKKIAVCPHYFAVAPQEYAALCPILRSRGVATRKKETTVPPRLGDASSVPAHHVHHEEEERRPAEEAGMEKPLRVVVFDLARHSDVIASMEKLAVEFAWLAAYFSLPKGVEEKAVSEERGKEAETEEEAGEPKTRAGDILLIRLPFSHVPSVDALTQAMRDGEGVHTGPKEDEKEDASSRTVTSTARTTAHPNEAQEGKDGGEGGQDASAAADSSSFSPPPEAMKAGLAQRLLHLMDFMGQHLSILWESGLQCSALPAIGFIGSDEDETLHGVYHSMLAWEEAKRSGKPQERSAPHSQARTDAPKATTLLWVMSDEVKAEELQKSRALLQKLVALSATSLGHVEVEHWSVPLKALKEGAEDEWDLYTQREMARLNFCPCCGNCGDDHTSGEHHH